eukprot:366332-Chlamydomonas_euryale.AAC.10
MADILQMDDDRLSQQGRRNIRDFSVYGSAIRGCHEEGSGGGATFRDFLNLPGHIKLISWPEIRAAAAGCALDRQAWRDAIKNLAPLQFKKPLNRLDV